MADTNDYFNRLQQLAEPTSANMIALGAWVEQDALPWLWAELGGIVLEPKRKHPNATRPPSPSRLLPMKDADAVRQGLFVSASDYRSKLALPAYYRAQLTMLDAEARRYCASIDTYAKASSVFADEAVVHTLHRALHDIMEHVLPLMETAAQAVADMPAYYAAWRRPREMSFEVFKGAEQIIYGTYSGMTHADRAPYTPVAVLRTAIELRLRHAFCVSSLVDPDRPDELIPIDLSSLFEAIQSRQQEIEFIVDLHDVWKIYRWSNFYLHGGVRDYPWVPGFVLQYLRPLFADPRIGATGAWNINGGIRMRSDAWHAVRAALQPPNGKRTVANRIGDAWRALVSPRKRQLQLPAADIADAQCVILD